jgi:hypothetical protein
MDLTIYAQAGNAAIWEYIKPQMRLGLVAVNSKPVMAIPLERALGHNNFPVGDIVRVILIGDTSLKRSCWREIAGEMPGIEIDMIYDAVLAKLDNAVIMSGYAFAAAFPPVHPFAIIIIFVRDENRFCGQDQSFFGSKEVITGINDLGAEAWLGQINMFLG